MEDQSLKKISMHVHKSEIVGVLGPNGCGKSTLYGVCVGEHRTDNGKIILNNKELQDLPIHLRAKMDSDIFHNREVYLI